jgi:ATP-dependent DNA helicase RecG
MTSPASLRRIIRSGESERVEFKESFDKAALESICAFANTQGGTLLVGVTDKGAIRGVPSPSRAIHDWADQIDQVTGLHPSVEAVSLDGKAVVAIKVAPGRLRPVLIRGRA